MGSRSTVRIMRSDDVQAFIWNSIFRFRQIL